MNDRRKNLSLAEIGRRFHVSAATVSNILNNKGKFSPELAGKILAFVDEVEYRPNLLAQSLKGNSKIVGFCLRGNLEDPWYIRVMAEVQNGLRRHGFYVGTVLGEQDLLQVRQTLDLFIQLRAAAVVLGPLGYTAEYEELRPVLDKLNFVTAFDTLEPMPLPSVRVNVYRAASAIFTTAATAGSVTSARKPRRSPTATAAITIPYTNWRCRSTTAGSSRKPIRSGSWKAACAVSAPGRTVPPPSSARAT